MISFLRKSRSANALLIATFLSVIGIMLALSVSSLSSNNSRQIINNKESAMAYYAAEAGVADSTDFLNTSFQNWGTVLINTDLPTQSTKTQLSNGAEYWVSNLSYANNNKIAIIDIIGKYKEAYRKLRVRISSSIPKYFDDYGLLTDGTLTINGKKVLDMSVHANDGLVLNGPTTMQDNTIATQSVNQNEDDPDPVTNQIGGYIDPIDVPLVPINELRELAKGGTRLDLNDPDLSTKISQTPAGSFIYISNTTNSNNSLNISGNMQSRIIFIDSNIIVNGQNFNVSNVMIISAGGLTVNGSVDFVSSHSGMIDTVFACNNAITLNGSRTFKSLFWTNDSFRQNGSSMAGRVIAQNGITFNGNFTLSSSGKLFDFGTFNNIASLSSWQQVSMDQ